MNVKGNERGWKYSMASIKKDVNWNFKHEKDLRKWNGDEGNLSLFLVLNS